jgi:hypothetical protein
MLIVGVTDIHGHTAGMVRLAPVLSAADLVLVSGDITNFGGKQEAEAVLDQLATHSKNILAVPGNCDRPEVGDYLSEKGLNLDGRAVEKDGLWFVGLGGSLPCPGRTLLEYGEDELRESLDSAYQEIPEGRPFLLLCHQPPYGTKVDRVMGSLHVGSRAIRGFIEDKKPLACICGHIHESAETDSIGETIVCNPGPLGRGGYVRAEWQGGGISVRLESLSRRDLP